MKFFEKIRPPYHTNSGPDDIGIEFFRQTLLYYLLLCTFVLGILVYIPCIYFAVKFNLPSIAVLDTVAMVLIGFLFFSGRLSFSTRATGILAVFYLLGTGLLIGVGPMGAGFLWLVLFSAMTGVLLGTRPAFYSLFINTVTYLLLGIFIYFESLPWISAANDAFALWLIIGINFLCIIAVMSISVSILLTKVNQQFEHEKKTSATLKKEIQIRIKTEKENQRLAGQLLHAKKMEALGTLAGGVAHDFNNVLSAILGYAELSLLGLKKEDEIYHHIQSICVASERARGIIHQILTFSRQADPQKELWSIASIIDESSRLFQVSIPHHVDFSTAVKTGYDDLVLADRTQIYQVVINLCTNALHAIGDSPGKIELLLETEDLQAGHELASVLTPGPYFKISIKDTGCGIEKDTLSKIFEPYFTTKSIGKGSGMGLSIAHGIIKNHHGDISVSSRPGQGSTFSIYLPVPVDAAAPQGKTEDTATAVHGDEHILFVDDEPHLLTIGKAHLERLGYRVDVESDPVTALETFKADPGTFQMVITDKKMPLMTGDVLKSNIKKIRPDVPVLLYSGFADEIDFSTFDSVLVKPVNADILAKCIRSVLDKKG